MTKCNANIDYFTYPLIPLLLTAENEERFRIKYDALIKLLDSNVNVKLLAIKCANTNISHSYRGVVLYNQNTRQIELVFENGLSITAARPVIFMFTGVGSQYVDMGKGLYEKAAVFKEAFDYSCEFLKPLLNKDLKEVVFSHAAPANESVAINDSNNRFDLKKMLNKSKGQLVEKTLLHKTGYLHPLLFAAEYSLARLLMQWGVMPTALIGHSVGEYVAAAISGSLSMQDALNLLTRRAKLIEALPPGIMVTVLAGKDEIDNLIKENDKLFLAAENSPISCTISGIEEDISKLEEELEKRDIVFLRLSTDRAFHSAFMEPIAAEFKKAFDSKNVNHIEIPFISNLTGDWATYEQLANCDNWLLHTCKTVRFSKGIQKLLDIRDSVLIEIGPGQTLTGFAFQHKYKDNNPNALILPVLRNANDNLSDNIFLLHALCKLWINGIAIDWNKVLNFHE